jgi:hypothetical protein
MRVNNVELSEFSPKPGWFVAVYTEDCDVSISGYGSNKKEAFDNLVESLYDLDIQLYKDLCFEYIHKTPYQISYCLKDMYIHSETGEPLYDLDDIDPDAVTLLEDQFVIEAVMPGCLDRFGLVYGNIEDENDLWKQFFEDNFESIMS